MSNPVIAIRKLRLMQFKQLRWAFRRNCWVARAGARYRRLEVVFLVGMVIMGRWILVYKGDGFNRFFLLFRMGFAFRNMDK